MKYGLRHLLFLVCVAATMGPVASSAQPVDTVEAAGIELSKGSGDIRGGSPISLGSAGQADITTDAMHVCVEGYEQSVGPKFGPMPKVDGVRAANHPTEKHVVALASAAAVGVRQQM